MNKTVVLGLGVVGGAAIFWAWRQRQKTNTTMGVPAPNGSAGTSPAKSGARVDNQNQPWYVGPRNAMDSKIQDYQRDPTVLLKDGQSIIHSVSDIWGTVSGFFGGDEGSKGSADDLPTFGENYNLPGSGDSQSNLLGAEIGKFDDFDTEPIVSYGDETFDWGLEYSDSNAIGSENFNFGDTA